MNDIIHYMMKENAPAKERSAASNTTVGLPRAMTYYEHGKLWQNFFTLLGCTVILSPETNRRILDMGVANCSNETCLPVKVMAGHVMEIADKCDVVFIPRYMSTARHELCCPKLCALPDMMRLNLKNRVDIMEITVDFDKGQEKSRHTLESVARRLEVDEDTVVNAFNRAVTNKINADAKSRLGAEMEVGMLGTEKSIAVLGHPYMIHDRFLSMNLTGKLRAAHYNVITPDVFSHRTRLGNAYPYEGGQRNFYGIGSDNLGCAYACVKRPEVAGIVYLTPFSCGVDSLVTEFIERHLKTDREVPLLTLTVDEHTGEAGFDTRIEAFLDMLE